MNQELIHKYLKGDTLPQENLDILAWIEESAENRKEFMQFRRLYDKAIWSESKDENIKIEGKLLNTKFSIRFFKDLLKVAAVIAFAIGGTLLVQNGTIKPTVAIIQIVEVPLGQHANLTLSDGTRVSLNSNSKLRFPTTFDADNRTVFLDGEGYFEVSHNARKPFHVMTQKCDLKVLGTTFNVFAYNNSRIFETSLLKGSVLVSSVETSQNVLLRPNEKVQIKDGKLIASKIKSEEDFLWRRGIYEFENESLNEIFKKLESYYQTQIIVRNTDISQYKCTGKFRQRDGIEHIIKVLRNSHEFNYQIDEETNTIVIQ
jgi:ferric-dicitrate binding protein FerR (iron transport regulator)